MVAPAPLQPVTSPEDAADVIDKNGRTVLSWRDRLIRLQAWVKGATPSS